MIRRSNGSQVCDVFLSASPADEVIAQQISETLKGRGWAIFSTVAIKPEHRWADTVRDALAESWVVVVVVSRDSAGSPAVTFEVGAASAWAKPVFVVVDNLRASELPAFLHAFPHFSPGEIGKLTQAIEDSKAPLSADEQDRLVSLYRKARIPTDRLMAEPVILDKLTREFNASAGGQRSGEVLLRQLLRMRKAGSLPRLGSRSAIGSKKAS
jgi:hypothetical protein